MSVDNIITENLDIWTSAIKTKSSSGRGNSSKLELYGIKKLRELIVDYAVHGKFTAGRTYKASPRELVEKAIKEKNELAKERKLRDSKIEYTDAVAGEFPEHWEVVNIGQIAHVLGGKRVPKGYSLLSDKTNHVYLRVTDMKRNSIDDSDLRYITPEVYEQIERYTINEQDLYITIAGTIGSVGTIPKHFDGANLTENAAKLVFREISKDYLVLILTSKYVQNQFEIAVNQMAQPKLSLNSIKTTLIPIPSKTEQEEIVARVEKLMSLCDQLESQTEASTEAHQTLVKSLLETLTIAKDADELNESWQCISEHFDVLFTTEDSIDQLKQTIMQLAVMGKLVKQDPNDEPASELLERIAAEKLQLIKDKKIKRTKELPSIRSSEGVVPENWVLTRLGSIINLVSGQHLKPTEYSDSSDEEYIPYITGPAEFGDVYPEFSKFTKYKKAVANKGDILITCKGAGLGKLNIANTNIAISRQLMGIKPLLVDNEYIFKLLTTLYPYFQSKGVGIAIPGISRDDVTDVVVLLPPLKEQNRIVERIKKLEVILEELKERLQSSNKTKCKMCDSVGLVQSETVNADTVKANEEPPKLDDLLETIWGALGSKSIYTGYITPKSFPQDNYFGMMEKSVGLTVLGQNGEKGVKYTRFGKLVSNLKSIVFVEDKLGLSGIPLLGSLVTSILNSFGLEVKLDQKAAIVLLCFPPTLKRTAQELLDGLIEKCKQYKLQTIDEQELGRILSHFYDDGLMTKHSNGVWVLKEKFKHEIEHW